MIRVLVADDSPTVRSYLRHVLETDPEIAVIEEVAEGPAAVRRTEQLQPDLVIMDVHMPGCDGLEATRRIMTTVPTPIIVISGASDTDGVSLSFQATEAGALTAMPKPARMVGADSEFFAEELRAMAKAMSEVKVVRRWKGKGWGEARPAAASPPDAVSVIGIGASTGGPVALRTILKALPGDFPVPIVVVQHIAKGFTPGLRDWLADGVTLEVEVATMARRVHPGTVYLAPDDRHLTLLEPDLLTTSAAPPVGRFRPSVSVLFESLARVAGASALAVILTGMGDDGVSGAASIRDAGGYVMGQDRASSVVYGMAKEAKRANVVSEELTLERIAPRLLDIVGSAP